MKTQSSMPQFEQRRRLLPAVLLLPALLALLAGGPAAVVEAKELVGRVDDRRIKEASGLVASKRNRGVLWTHNDSGDFARVFALSAKDGRVLHELTVLGAGASDWEDMALSPFGQLCAGDIGDGPGGRRSVTVYCFDEPYVDGGGDDDDDETPEKKAKKKKKSKTYSSTHATPYHLDYPEGAHDAETLLIDPQTNSFCVVTKNGEQGSELYVARAPKPWAHTELELRRKVHTYGGWAGPVAGDITWDGEHVVLKSYGYYFYLFTRAAFFASDERGDYSRPYIVGTDYDPAEAVAFDAGSDNAVFTLTEGAGSPLHRYDL